MIQNDPKNLTLVLRVSSRMADHGESLNSDLTLYRILFSFSKFYTNLLQIIFLSYEAPLFNYYIFNFKLIFLIETWLTQIQLKG